MQSTTGDRTDLLISFVTALVDHYGAQPIKSERHRCFINPWSTGSGNHFIFIRARDMTVRYGSSITRSSPMSDRMIASIASRTQQLPRKPAADTTLASPVDR